MDMADIRLAKFQVGWPTSVSQIASAFRYSRRRWRQRRQHPFGFPYPKPGQAGLASALLRRNHIDVVDTKHHIWRMSKSRRSSSESFATGPIAIAEHSRMVNVRGSINLRIESHTRQLIDNAAAILGKTRTEFMIESARRQAIDVLLDQRLFVLDPERYEAFIDALDNSPAPGPKLRSLLSRVPAWPK
jgi:uncharacterized protein (DUF1778 family)